MRLKLRWVVYLVNLMLFTPWSIRIVNSTLLNYFIFYYIFTSAHYAQNSYKKKKPPWLFSSFLTSSHQQNNQKLQQKPDLIRAVFQWARRTTHSLKARRSHTAATTRWRLHSLSRSWNHFSTQWRKLCFQMILLDNSRTKRHQEKLY